VKLPNPAKVKPTPLTASLSGGKLGFAFPALDLSTVNDIIATLTILCQ
jgi:hypothetical protein